MINKIKGHFEQFQASVHFDPSDLTALNIRASIEANSITTRQRQRDEHLRSEDFFHTAKYPSISFESTGCTVTGERQCELKGHLTLHGVTTPVIFHTVFEALNKDPRGRERVGFHSTANIDRNEFGLVFNSLLETGGMIVGNEVTIELSIEAIKID